MGAVLSFSPSDVRRDGTGAYYRRCDGHEGGSQRGLADRLAASHECNHPWGNLAGVPRITSNLLPSELRGSDEIDAAVRSAVSTGHGLYALDESELARLDPDLVLAQELCQVCAVSYPRVVEAARLAGGGPGPMVVSLEPHSIADVFATLVIVEAGERSRSQPEMRLPRQGWE